MKNFTIRYLLLSFLVMGGVSSVFAQTELENVLSSMGIVQEDQIDLSDESAIEIDEPQRAIVNFTGISAMPISKTSNYHAWMEVYDRNGHYFKKRVIMNAQGATSLSYEKKNIAIDICEDEWIGDKTTDMTIGNWVTQDAFHLKAFYIDYLKGIGEVEYKLFHQILADRTPYWERAGIDGDDKALCHPDAFPCEVYLNGEFYGMYAWQLKKNRKNMNLTKDVAEHIHLDGDINGDYILGGSINWTEFEVKNPKNLYCVDTETISGYIYVEITDDEAELATMGDNYVDAPSNPKDMASSDLSAESPLYYKYVTSKGKIKYYKLIEQNGYAYLKYDGDHPKELIDETMPYYDPNNKNHVLTAKVKAYIIKMSRYMGEIQALIDDGADASTVRTAFEARFDKDSWIDYDMFHILVMNRDGSRKNWQWFTYDGNKWMVAPYDLDATYGNSTDYSLLPPNTGVYSASTRVPMNILWNYYKQDIIDRYKEMRESGIITANNINTLISNWYSRFGANNYAREMQRWPNAPCYNEPICNPNWTYVPYGNWSQYSSLPDYSDAVTYNAGDRCKLSNCIWEATGTTTGVKPYKKIRHEDSLERYLDFTERRLAYLDKYFKLTKTIAEPATYTLYMTSARWSTICLPLDFDVPANLKVYEIMDVDNATGTLQKELVSEAVGYKSYLVNAEPGIYLLVGTDAVEPSASDWDYLKNGLMTGVLSNQYVDAGNYVLQSQNGKLGFYKVISDNTIGISANKAYLTLPSAAMAAAARQVYFFDEDITADIDAAVISTPGEVVKIYSVDGRELQQPVPGLNIIKLSNGETRKVIIR